MSEARLLVVEDEPDQRRLLSDLLAAARQHARNPGGWTEGRYPAGAGPSGRGSAAAP